LELIIICSNLDLCGDRCFVDGCDNPVDPVYKADWLNESNALSSLLSSPRDLGWRCSYKDFDEMMPNASKPECAYSNYTANVKCDQWVFDKSVFTSTIVTDVSGINLFYRIFFQTNEFDLIV
jgi:hypothetical protein